MSTGHLICVVDDDSSMLRMLTRAIKAAGCDVASYGSGEDFLNCGRINEFACLILDVDLPGISGLELQAQLNRTGQNLPVIFISGEATQKTRQRALSAGARAFFDKPFNMQSLLAAVRSIETPVLN